MRRRSSTRHTSHMDSTGLQRNRREPAHKPDTFALLHVPPVFRSTRRIRIAPPSPPPPIQSASLMSCPLFPVTSCPVNGRTDPPGPIHDGRHATAPLGATLARAGAWHVGPAFVVGLHAHCFACLSFRGMELCKQGGVCPATKVVQQESDLDDERSFCKRRS